jgi:tetratricopeptide (TPR) repeat protein
MRRITFVLCITLISCTFLTSCRKKQKSIEPPSEPTVTQPSAPTPEPPPPAEAPPSAPAPERKPLEAKPLKPRAQATGDPTALKLVDRGLKLMNANRLDEAEQTFEQAVRVSPTNGKPFYYLGVIAVKQKAYDRAIGFFTQAEVHLHSDPFWMSQVLLGEGQALKGLNKKAEAKAKFQQALQKDPTNKWAAAELKSVQ